MPVDKHVNIVKSVSYSIGYGAVELRIKNGACIFMNRGWGDTHCWPSQYFIFIQ